MGSPIPAGDVDALAAAISKLLATPAEELSRLGANGRERVLQNHDVRQEAARLHQLITSGNDDSRPARYDTKLPPDKKRELQQAQS
jgi:glycosyltransferase involved in cell wall biosynthesis